MNDVVTAIVDENFDIHQHLAHIRRWQNEYFSEDEQLQSHLPLRLTPLNHTFTQEEVAFASDLTPDRGA
jgi:2-iminoacetate synthase ThiH